MPQSYLAISKSNRSFFGREIDAIKQSLQTYGIDLFVFLDKYNFKLGEEKEMMQKAFKEIDESEFLIAEVSKKAIGVGVEVGYAAAKGKPIIYLKKAIMPYSTTIGGSADYFIEYENVEQLEEKFTKILLSGGLGGQAKS